MSSLGRAGRGSFVDARARPTRARDFLERPAFAGDLDLAEAVGPRLAGEVPSPFGGGGQIGPYRLLRTIATGGMGIVLEGVHSETRRPAAVKLLRGGSLVGRGRRELFRLQVSALEHLRAAPRHPGIVELVESGETVAGTPWYAMELVRGVSLDRHVASGSAALPELLQLFVELCDAVHHAHSYGVVHGDLGPANALVAAGGRSLVVVDFGRRLEPRDATDASVPEGAGAVQVGTLAYAAPERVTLGADRLPSVASDVFSLGAMLFELLVGVPPHDLRELGLLASIRRVGEGVIRRPWSLRAGVAPELERLALAALDRDPGGRPASALELGRAVERHLRDEGSKPRVAAR